ncbi:MAG: GGDEF domain-containing protein [Lachnospiraceae bacterium]|nr:GGDEF domain-containing protein [Lachnospiraceae bacterium]
MVGNELFMKISGMLKEHPESIETQRKAAEYVTGLYPIGKIEKTIFTNLIMLPFDDEKVEFVLFDSGDYCEEGKFTVEMKFEECGGIVSHIYPTKEAGEFTEEQKSDIHIIGSLFHYYVGHYKIMRSLEKATTNNHMTGLPNPKGYIIQCMEVAKKGNIQNYDSCYFNIKGFGLANNMFGPIEGDNIIKRYAKDLENFKEDDEVVGHLGGDNFVALIKRSRMDDFIDYVLNYTGYGMKNERKKEIKFGASIGIAPLNIETSRAKDIISEAALAFGYARATKQEIVVLDDKLTDRLRKKKMIEESFETALENGEFVPYYQPKADIRNGKIVGVEALSRWIKDGKIISPAEFIPVLEENGSITMLDFYIFESVCKNVSDWAKLGHENVPVSVNFSRKHLDDDNLADRINQIISRYDVNREMIIVEITETADYDEKELMTNFLDKMQVYNIKTSIDDFGSGYSSLGVLRDFAVNEIKIDRSFVNREDFSERDRVIVGSIVDMARNLNLSVITEGVETKGQLEFLKGLGCYYVQGFYFDKPLPQLEFEERLLSGGYKNKI